MPTYSFVCECGCSYEEFRWFSQGMPEKCPSCGATYGEAFNQNFKENTPTCWDGRVTTYGQQAAINAKRLGKEQMEKMAPKEEVEAPWWRDGSIPGTTKMDKPLDLKKIPDVKRYVEEGR